MLCYRCGYCCMMYDVIIIKDIEKEIDLSNMEYKPSGQRCKHLQLKDDKYECSIHEHPNYKETPCYAFGQIEMTEDTPCRVGNKISNDINLIKKLKEIYGSEIKEDIKG